MATDTIAFSSTIYSTPETWGSYTTWGDYETMQGTVRDLIEAGGEDWANISVDDCTEYDLVETIGDAAIYQECNRRTPYYITVRMGGDMEPIVQEGFENVEDARDSLS